MLKYNRNLTVKFFSHTFFMSLAASVLAASQRNAPGASFGQTLDALGCAPQSHNHFTKGKHHHETS
jgi:hypothetical protein